MKLLPFRILIATATVLLSGTVLLAQIIPATPNAGSMAKFANIPVNSYTGTPSIQAPLVTVPGRGVSVPVGLSYHASGIKVHDYASSTGLGFSLNAGGAITRVVRGLPDESPEGYCGPNQRGSLVNQEDITNYGQSYLHKVGTSVWDAEPDIFYFNFMGRTGRFVLNADRKAVLVPYQNILVSLEDETDWTKGWTIVTEDGMKYRFGHSAATQEEVSATIEQEAAPDQTKSYIATWYLQQITVPNTNEVIDFTYTEGNEVTTDYYNYLETKVIDNYNTPNATELSSNEVAIVTTLTTKPSKYISRISSSLGYAELAYYHQRQDITNDVALTDVKLFNHRDRLIQHLRLVYDYFEYCPLKSCKRLKLDRIIEKSATESIPMYRFTYNTEVNLPSRYDQDFDHWGYYNTSDSHGYAPATTYDGIFYEGANRTPDATRTQANILMQVDLPTGGYTRFSYESNTAQRDNETVQVGGVRIKNIQQYDDLSKQTITKEYVYHDSGLAFDTPTYVTGLTVAGNPNAYTLKRYAKSLNSLYDVNGASVGYSKVTEQTTGNGSVTTSYTDLVTNPDDVTEVYLISSFGREPRGTDLIPHPANTSYGWQRGLVDAVEVKDQSGRLQSRTDYNYNFDTPVNRVAKGLAVYQSYYVSNSGGTHYILYAGQYEVVSQPFFLDYKIEEVYDQGDESKFVSTRTDYEYDPTYLQVKKETTTDSEGTEWVTEHGYPTDFAQVMIAGYEPDGSIRWTGIAGSRNVDCIRRMLSTHRHNQRIQTTRRRKKVGENQYKTISGELTLFSFPDGASPEVAYNRKVQFGRCLRLPTDTLGKRDSQSRRTNG